MKKLLATAAAVVVSAGVVASPASAAVLETLLIDDFTDSQRVSDLPGMDFPQSSRISGGMIGGTRLMEVETDSASAFPGETTLSSEADADVPQGQLTFSNNTNATGRGWVVYDGLTDGPSSLTATSPGFGIDPNKLFDISGGALGLDLTFGGFSPSDVFFQFDFDLAIEGPLYFAAAAFDGTNYAFFDEVFPQGAAPEQNLFLSEFSVLGGGTFDWSNTQGISYLADSVWQDGGITGLNDTITAGSRPSFDGGIFNVSVQVIPLPASVLMLLGGLGSLAGVSVVAKRRRRTDALPA